MGSLRRPSACPPFLQPPSLHMPILPPRYYGHWEPNGHPIRLPPHADDHRRVEIPLPPLPSLPPPPFRLPSPYGGPLLIHIAFIAANPTPPSYRYCR